MSYPSMNDYWPAVRAKKFITLLGQEPKNYDWNMRALAQTAGVHVFQMDGVNPITFGERNFPSVNLRKILGQATYQHLEHMRYNGMSATWAYEKNLPIPVLSPGPWLDTRPNRLARERALYTFV